LLWQVRYIKPKERVRNPDAIPVVEIKGRNLLANLNYQRPFQKDLTVKVCQYFSNEYLISKTLCAEIVEKVYELLVVAFKQSEAQFVFEVRR